MQLLSVSHSSRPQLKPSTSTPTQPTVVPSPSHSTTPNYSASLVTRKRGRTFDFDADSAKRRRGAQSYSSRQSGEKQHNKGLRHFSQRVCEKVREKGATTYNEVHMHAVNVHVFTCTCTVRTFLCTCTKVGTCIFRTVHTNLPGFHFETLSLL